MSEQGESHRNQADIPATTVPDCVVNPASDRTRNSPQISPLGRVGNSV